MQLYGSTTSPYVRRIRILLDEQPYEFVPVNIFAHADRVTFAEQNPTLKLPMLKDGKQVVFDSGVIFEYLADKLKLQALTWDQKNLLSAIDSANDSLVQMMILSRSGIDIHQDVMYFNVQRERCEKVFAYLDKAANEGAFADWHYASISLYACLDWVLFRELFDLSPYQHLASFLANNASKQAVTASDPR